MSVYFTKILVFILTLKQQSQLFSQGTTLSSPQQRPPLIMTVRGWHLHLTLQKQKNFVTIDLQIKLSLLIQFVFLKKKIAAGRVSARNV